MRRILLIAAGTAMLAPLAGCASDTYGDRYADRYLSACERDYQRNRDAATAAGALIGGAAGAAIARNDTAGAIAGGIAGGLVGRSLATRDDPCGYGFTGYPVDREYGYWDDRAGVWRRG